MIEYSKDDIDYNLAYAAHQGTSHTPDVRAEQVQASYMQEIDSIIEAFLAFATDENKHELAGALEYYREGYARRLSASLSAQSRCMSTMITGPSNFPTARNEKRNNTADKRRDEWLEWSKKAKEKMRRRFDPAIRERAPISSDDSDAIAKLQVKIEKLEALQTVMKVANKILRQGKLTNEQKIEQLIVLGIPKFEARELFEPDDFTGRIGYPAYRLTNNSATIRQAKKRIAQLEQEHESRLRGCNEDYQIGDVTISENTDLNRLQLFFPAKPDEEMRSKLKANGFKWASSQGAWQRQLTDNARYAVKRVLDVE